MKSRVFHFLSSDQRDLKGVQDVSKSWRFDQCKSAIRCELENCASYTAKFVSWFSLEE
jgi:hypothetical protein